MSWGDIFSGEQSSISGIQPFESGLDGYTHDGVAFRDWTGPIAVLSFHRYPPQGEVPPTRRSDIGRAPQGRIAFRPNSDSYRMAVSYYDEGGGRPVGWDETAEGGLGMSETATSLDLAGFMEECLHTGDIV